MVKETAVCGSAAVGTVYSTDPSPALHLGSQQHSVMFSQLYHCILDLLHTQTDVLGSIHTRNHVALVSRVKESIWRQKEHE